ncbi:MAG TPA: winged helix-turn-helix domain-containing protein [Solirubrobacteraceae bacterium]|jgi:hypothetical protein|nr:winged helix-turn-helix domain-containing protein [Solirubrobacteraceae bacterium]
MQVTQLNDADKLGAPMLEEIRRTAERRLHELEPLIEEAERLRDVLAVIEERTVPTPRQHPLTPAGRVRRAGGAQPASSGRAARVLTAPRAAKGANKRLILELIEQRPGITPAEIARTTGLKRTVVASTVSRLKRYGELCDHEQGGVRLPAAADDGTNGQPRRGKDDGAQRPHVALVQNS